VEGSLVVLHSSFYELDFLIRSGMVLEQTLGDLLQDSMIP
jgi:hypothetical protein